MEDKNILKKGFKRDYLPSELVMNILYRLESFKDLKNAYKVFKYHNQLIEQEIDDYLNIRYKHKHWIHKLIKSNNFIYDYINTDESDIWKDDKDEMLEEIKEMYNEDNISKKLIKYYLECYNCDYIFDEKRFKHFQYCFNCEKTFCSDCYTECYKCDIKGNYPYYPCLKCKKQCAENAINDINNTHEIIINSYNFREREKYTDNLKSLITDFCVNITKPLWFHDDIYHVYNLLIKIYNRNNNYIQGVKIIFNDEGIPVNNTESEYITDTDSELENTEDE